jgi:hypothetical protein
VLIDEIRHSPERAWRLLTDRERSGRSERHLRDVREEDFAADGK